MDRPQLSLEGPTVNETRLIGIELAVQHSGNRETELEMHGMRHTIETYPGHNYRARVTIHTSNGDVTVTCPLRPGNYQAHY